MSSSVRGREIVLASRIVLWNASADAARRGPSCAYPFYRATGGPKLRYYPFRHRFFSNAVPSVEAIPMVNMVVNSPDVAHGLASGAAINVELNSGTNQFHGEVSAATVDGTGTGNSAAVIWAVWLVEANS